MNFIKKLQDFDSFQITDYLNDLIILVSKSTKEIEYLNYQCEEVLRVSKKTLLKKSIKNLFNESSVVFDYISKSFHEYGTFTFKEIYIKTSNQIQKYDLDIINSQEHDFTILVLKNDKNKKKTNDLQSNSNLLIFNEILDKILNKIKNPLSSIKGSAQLLNKSNVNNNERNELFEIIVSEVDKVVDLIKVFEGEQRSLSLVEKKYNIHEIIRSSLGKINNIIKKNIKIIENFDPSLPNITLNKDKFINVFYNILINSIEAINIEDGYIKISTSYHYGETRKVPHIKKKGTQNYIIVEIEDNGIGIEKDNEQKIFLPFYSTKDNKNGLGLYFAKKIVMEYDCDLEFLTNNKNSIFKVRIPV